MDDCFVVVISNDFVLENNETFSLTLSVSNENDPPIILLAPSLETTEITVIDDDSELNHTRGFMLATVLV